MFHSFKQIKRKSEAVFAALEVLNPLGGPISDSEEVRQ